MKRVSDYAERKHVRDMRKTWEDASKIVRIRKRIRNTGVTLDHSLRRECATGMICYASLGQAKTVAKDLRHYKIFTNAEHTPYSCPYCNKWHLERTYDDEL